MKMRVSPQRLFIPLLVSFALTGAGSVLIYFINKKRDEEEQRIKSRKAEQNSVEIRIPCQFVPAIIGRAGSVIQNIQECTGTLIKFKEENVDSLERTCIITGSPENIEIAEKKIQSILDNQPLIETYEIWVPQRTVTGITERGSEILNQIQNSSNAKIIIDNYTPSTDLNAKKRIIIKGTAQQIACALLQVEDKVREDNEAQAKTDKSSSSRVPRVKTSPTTSPESTVKDVNYSKEVFGNQANEGLIEVFVCAMESPSQFYIQMVGPTNEKLDDLIKEMTAYYEYDENRELHALHNITVDSTVAAKFPVDNKWYRAKIVADLGDHLYDVYFVDFGDREKIDSKDICELRTDYLSLRLQAIECSLSGVKPWGGGEWSLQACESFAQLSALANWHSRVAKIRGYKERATSCGSGKREGSPIPCIELYQKLDDQLFSIGQELIQLEQASPESEPWSAASSTVSLSKRAKSPEVSTNGTSSGTTNGSSKPNEEIDLTWTPHSEASNNIEAKDLTSPAKDSRTESTRSFIENERNTPITRNGSGDGNPRKNIAVIKTPANLFRRSDKPVTVNVVPAGYESDYTDEEEFDYN